MKFQSSAQLQYSGYTALSCIAHKIVHWSRIRDECNQTMYKISIGVVQLLTLHHQLAKKGVVSSVKALKYLSFDSALWKRFAPELFFELIDFFSESLESLTVTAIAQIDFHY